MTYLKHWRFFQRTPYLWTLWAFPLWPIVQFWWHWTFVVAQIVSCWKTQEAYWTGYHGAQLLGWGVCVDLKDFIKVWIGQDCFLSNSSLYIIVCFLMDFSPVPGDLLGSFGLWDLSLTTLSNQPCCCTLPRGLYNTKPSPETCGVLWHFWAVLVQASPIPCSTVV